MPVGVTGDGVPIAGMLILERVGDPRSRRLHAPVVRVDVARVYAGLLRPSPELVGVLDRLPWRPEHDRAALEFCMDRPAVLPRLRKRSAQPNAPRCVRECVNRPRPSAGFRAVVPPPVAG